MVCSRRYNIAASRWRPTPTTASSSTWAASATRRTRRRSRRSRPPGCRGSPRRSPTTIPYSTSTRCFRVPATQRVLLRPAPGRLRADPQLLPHRQAALPDRRLRPALRGGTQVLGSRRQPGTCTPSRQPPTPRSDSLVSVSGGSTRAGEAQAPPIVANPHPQKN